MRISTFQCGIVVTVFTEISFDPGRVIGMIDGERPYIGWTEITTDRLFGSVPGENLPNSEFLKGDRRHDKCLIAVSGQVVADSLLTAGMIDQERRINDLHRPHSYQHRRHRDR